MNVIHEKLTQQRFRKLYASRKPQFELIGGLAEPKASGSKRHALLQLILCRILRELGFRAWPELTLAIDDAWEPVPDVAGTLGPEETQETYQSRPVAVAIEILSPSDRFTLLDQKCRKYADWGVADILLFDSVDHRAWQWEAAKNGLIPITESYSFRSKPGAALTPKDIFWQLEEKLQTGPYGR
jgi:Uma2 family endonuclease